jgi:hypothetical protein
LKSYLTKIHELASRGDAREESFYPLLAEVLKQYADSTGKTAARVTTLPKKTEAGNPDFRVWDGAQHITGYLEAKAPTVGDLNPFEESEQVQRYRHTFPNLILTNFFEFRLYRNGELIDQVAIARPFVVHKLGVVPPVENEAEFLKLLETFFAFSLPRVYSAQTLAVELAKRTRFLKDQVVAEELKEKENTRGFIHGFYEAFQQYLIAGLSKEDFADLYSQTLAYGLFAARTRAKNGFNRKLAYDHIPRTIGILRDMFRFISLEDVPPQMEWIIDDLTEVLAVTDVNQLLHEFYREGKGRDPVIHFYETFLSEYDPATREKRGVYYTPEPVVSYIVRSLHHILKEKFNRRDGLADQAVTVLDPAAGTLTFLAQAARLSVEHWVSKYGEGAKELFIKECVLETYHAFELMMAPYAIGHLKMAFLLEELGYQLQPDERIKLYLTNTLEMEELAQTELPGMASLAEESHLAGRVKKEQPILVILGNPPYSGHSANRSPWMDDSLKKGYTLLNGAKDEGYYRVDGRPLGEKNPKWLQDDYVKFIRFAQWKIDQAGEGVLGFITNHSYLDNPTFRGMRQSLMNSFDEIYVLDLHGNSLKKEKCPDGSKDENVFDIQQGVAIALFVKIKDKEEEPIHPLFRPSPQLDVFTPKEKEKKKKAVKKKCRVHHADVWGLREQKYEWLEGHELKNTKWQKLKLKSEFYLFIPRDESGLKLYERSPKINEIFPVNSVGVVTSRDSFVIDPDPKALKRRIRMFCDESLPDELIRQTFNLKDKSSWKLKNARENLRRDDNWKEDIQKILYRPFDVQWILYHDQVIERTRKEVMQHMKQANIGLITLRKGLPNYLYTWAFVSDILVGHGVFYNGNQSTEYLFPLYLYSEGSSPNKARGTNPTIMMVFEPTEPYRTKKPNLNPALVESLKKAYGKTPTPEEIFCYIYAVLYSNIYRTQYAEFLKTDFPRAPFTSDYKLFQKTSKLGQQLVELHLLHSEDLNRTPLKLQGKGSGKVDKPQFDAERRRVFINPDQYFEKVEKQTWEYHIGGYQVCDKWLKDRKGRALSLDDIRRYSKIVTAIAKTIAIQKEIDKIYPEVERRIVEF